MLDGRGVFVLGSTNVEVAAGGTCGFGRGVPFGWKEVMGMIAVEASANSDVIVDVTVNVGNGVGKEATIREDASIVNAPALLILETAKSTMLI